MGIPRNGDPDGKVKVTRSAFAVTREFNGQQDDLQYKGKVTADAIKGKIEFRAQRRNAVARLEANATSRRNKSAFLRACAGDRVGLASRTPPLAFGSARRRRGLAVTKAREGGEEGLIREGVGTGFRHTIRSTA